MTIGNELRAWTADPARQKQARDAADAVARRWSEGPIHGRFAAAMAALEPGDASSVVAAVSSIFADDGWVAEMLATLAEPARQDPFFEPPFVAIHSDIHSGLLVFEDDHVSVAAGVCHAARLAAKKNGPRGRRSIAFTGHVAALKFVRAAGARLSFWEAAPITSEFTAAGAGSCRRTGGRAIEDGEILVVDGRRQSFVIEQAAANLVLLQAAVKVDQSPLRVEYDAESLRYVGCAAADDSASRIQMIATLLRKLDCAAAFPAVAAFVDHPDFFVRWHVMRELLGLDAMAALPHLKRMAALDPHSETRRAARTVLDRLESGAIARRKAA